MPLNDTTLLERWIARGDAEAFDEIVHRFADQVFGTARRILRNDADAEDVTQECFLLLVRSGGDVRTSLGGWLHRAATSRSLDRIRSEARRRAREQAYSEATAQAAEATWDDIQGHVDAAINQLPESTRDMIVAHFLGRKTHEEIAAELGMNRRTVSLRIQRGLESIRRDFARRGITLSAAALGPLLVDNLSVAAPLSLKASLGKLAIAAGTAGGVGAVTTTSLIGSLLIMKTKLAASIFTVGIVAAGAFFTFSRVSKSDVKSPQGSPSGIVDSVPVSTAPQTQTLVESQLTSLPMDSDGNAPESLEALLALSRKRLAKGLMGRGFIDDPAKYASVSGVVLDSNGYPIESATVTLLPKIGLNKLPGAESMTVATSSAADGSYRIEGIARTGTYWVNAAKPGYVNGARGALPDSPVEIVPGTNAVGIDFTLTKGITVRGRVHAANGRVVPNAFVQGLAISGLNSFTTFIKNGARTDEKGEFRLGFEDEYRGSVVALRVQTEAHGSSTFPAVPIDEEEMIELRLAEGAIIHGRVLDTEDRPIPDANLRFSARKSPAVEGGRSDSLSGAFPAVSDERGYYAVEVDSGLDFDVSTRDNGEEKYRQETIPALEPGAMHEYNLVLSKINTLTVIGRLIGADSGEVIAPPRGSCRIQVYKDETWLLDRHGGGEFKITLPLEAGSYRFAACYEFNDRVRGPLSGIYDIVDGEENRIEITVPDPQYLSLRAMDGEGNPIEGARLNIMTTTIENAQTNDLTNEDGRLDGPIVMPPDCGARLWLEKPGYAPAWGAIHENQSPGTVHPEDVIVMSPGAGIEGELADAEGGPVADLELLITLTSASGQSWPLETRTDGEGHFTVVDRAPSEVVDIEIGIKPQAGPVEIRLGNDLVSLPGGEVKERTEPTEPDLRVWRADQVALEAGAITDLGQLSSGGG